MKDKVYEMLREYAEGGLVSKNAMSDYFLASSGKMTEVEFVGKHKMSTLEFEKQFAEDNNVDISGTEKLSEVSTTPKGVKMDYSKKPKTMAEGGPVEIDPVSGNEIPPGSTPENVRDDIPAMLSEGEYVVPADVLKYFGVNFFEELRAKAKEGMMAMEMDGRTGGEPMGDTPMEQVPPQEEVPMMAEGGVVAPSFDPLAWTTPGLGGIAQPAAPATTEYKEYYGPNGVSQMFLFIDGAPLNAIPEGYSTTQPAAVDLVAPERDRGSNGDRNSNRTTTSAGTGSGPDVGGLFSNPLGELDFADPDSVATWAEGKLERSTLQRGLGMAGLGGALGSTALELRHIAEVSAAAKQYDLLGNQVESERLMGMANDARENYGFAGRWSENFSNGDDIFANYQESLKAEGPKVAPTRAPSEAVRVGSGTKTKSNDNDRSDFRSVTSPQPTSTSAKSRMAKTGTKPTTPKMNKGGLVAKRTTTKKK
jgi:hypothetical protein